MQWLLTWSPLILSTLVLIGLVVSVAQNALGASQSDDEDESLPDMRRELRALRHDLELTLGQLDDIRGQLSSVRARLGQRQAKQADERPSDPIELKSWLRRKAGM